MEKLTDRIVAELKGTTKWPSTRQLAASLCEDQDMVEIALESLVEEVVVEKKGRFTWGLVGQSKSLNGGNEIVDGEDDQVTGSWNKNESARPDPFRTPTERRVTPKKPKVESLSDVVDRMVKRIEGPDPVQLKTLEELQIDNLEDKKLVLSRIATVAPEPVKGVIHSIFSDLDRVANATAGVGHE